MQIRVVDFELVTKHFSTYQDGAEKIEQSKKEFIEKVDPYRREMQNILVAAQSGLIVDSMTQKQRTEKFQHMQKEIVELDKVFKGEVQRMRDELTTVTYKELEDYIVNFSKDKDFDCVIGKLEIVYCKEEFDITNQILEILKEKGVYREYIEEEEESLQQ
jgi:outer membrane protein